MYNARNYFQTAQERALSANGRPTPQAVADYTKTIQKCGIILSENPDGKRADDALFLMARALYYKKNSAFQAKDAFESLIRGYPNSKHVPESYIYLARVLREVNQPSESEAVLERFIRDPRYVDHHARALLVLADFEIQDEDYHRAQYWLERIISSYRHTREFREAYYLFGKNYFEQGEYQRSLDELELFVKTRGVDKLKRLEAQYYIAQNHYELGDTDAALRAARYLVRNEQRPDLLARARLILGRIILADGQIEDGMEELTNVTTSYPRTEHSAAAFFYMGLQRYYHESKIDEAVAQLNRVRGDFPRSEHADDANRIASALNQIKPNPALDIIRDADSWLEYHYVRAENFLDPLALPDSAMTTFQKVIAQKDTLIFKIQDYQTRVDSLASRIDSLGTLSPDPDSAEADVLPTEVPEEPISADPESPEEELQDTPDVPADMEPEPPSEDLSIEPEPADTTEPESEASEPDPDKTTVPEPDLATLQQIHDGFLLEIEDMQALLDRFDAEILPFAYYSIYSIMLQDSTREQEAEEIYQTLMRDYPRNMYSRAATALKEGRIPRLIDPAYEEALEDFDLALMLYPPDADSLVAKMQEFSQSDYDDLRLRANYRLGWHYSFEEADTTHAKQYLQAVLDDPEADEYATMVRRFYDGQKFLLRDSGLSDFEEDSDDAAKAPESEDAEPELEALPLIEDQEAIEDPSPLDDAEVQSPDDITAGEGYEDPVLDETPEQEPMAEPGPAEPEAKAQDASLESEPLLIDEDPPEEG